MFWRMSAQKVRPQLASKVVELSKMTDDWVDKLPKTDTTGNPITYQEWDVNAFQKGVNRGKERIVTGSDGSAYYTNDHYISFTPF